MTTARRDQVPPLLDDLVRGRDAAPLPPGALVRFQLIGLTPGIARNYRFVLLEDGGLLAAQNSADEPSDEVQRFNVALPEAPNAQVPDATVVRIRDLLRSSGFAASPRFVGNEGVRDGSLVIVTAKVDGQVHEVWFQNAASELTDLLASLYPEATEDEVDLDDLFAGLPELPEDAQ